ncbi:MAG: efflux RND transporter periplasmic adaptor subunit [Chitinivibrionales bacterium]|nr:efflux RND transporter periplasmic adaptor subunit [Chitinivibrionales bacterium]MBD3358411.1 efflux RND transporter periplasmic adaptor subunit [Chitinivibrionales bacterium]
MKNESDMQTEAARRGRGGVAPLCYAAGALFLVFTLLSFPGCSKGEAEERPAEARVDTIPVEVMELERETFTEYGEYYGQVSGIREATLVCVGGGRVSSLAAREGQWVKKDASLGRIDADKATTAYETAKLREKITRENYERTKKHMETGNASQTRVDQMRLEWLNAKSSLIDAKRLYEGALCITPIAGTVVSREIELDQELPPGAPTFSVAQLYKVKVVVGIPESDIAGVEIGSEATVTFDIYPGRDWTGKIKTVARKADPASKKFDAEVVIGNKDGTILSGVTARVRLGLRSFDEQVVVPTEAIRTVGTEHSVMVVENGKAQRRIIETGAANATYTVAKHGLEPGVNLIIAGHHLVGNGAPVKVIRRSMQTL